MLISVIIPTRDRNHFLSEAVASVQSQALDNLELIIVNDGVSEIPDYGDARIRVVSSGCGGAVAARNLGISEARGNVVAWLDDDDRWISPDHLRTAAQVLRSDDVLCFADGVMLFPGETVPRAFARDANAETLAADNTILISTVCYRRSLHDELGQFDSALPYYWDWDWYLRVVRSGRKTSRSTAPAVDIRIHPDNMSGDSNRAARQKNLDLLVQKHALSQISLKNHTDFASGNS